MTAMVVWMASVSFMYVNGGGKGEGTDKEWRIEKE